MKHLALALILAAGPVLAGEPPKPAAPAPAHAEAKSVVEPPKLVLTADEGRKLYELGVRTGLAQAAVQAAQNEMKPVLDKLAAAPR